MVLGFFFCSYGFMFQLRLYLKSFVNKVDLSWELRNKAFIKKEKIIRNGKIDLVLVGLGLTYLPHGSEPQKVDVAGQIQGDYREKSS